MGLLAAGAVLLLGAGCSSPAPPAVPTAPPSSTTASTEPCPDGTYLIRSLEGRGAASAVGKGSGGNIAVDFSAGDFTISSDGSRPVKLDIGPTNAEMRFDGEIRGTYEGEPSALRLTTTGARGDVTVKGFGFTRTRSAGGLANQLIGKGATAQVTCDEAAGTALVTLPNASLTLARQG